MLARILRYGAQLLGANVVVAGIAFLTGMLGAKESSREAYGTYASYVLVSAIGMSFATAGVNAVVQRFGAEEARRLSLAGLALRACLALLAIALVGGAIALVGFGVPYALGVLAVPLLALHQWARSIVRSSFEARHESALVVVASLSKSAMQLLFLGFGDPEVALVYGDFLGAALSAGLCLLLVPRALGSSLPAVWRAPLERSFLAELARFGWPLWLAGEVYGLRSSVVSAFTRGLLGADGLAAQGMADQLLRVAVKPAELFGFAALPGLVRAEGERSVVYGRALRFSVLVFPAIGVAVAAGTPLVLELFGVAEKYPEVPWLVVLMVSAFPAYAVELTLSQLTVAVGQSRPVLVAQALTVASLAALLPTVGAGYGLGGVVLVGSLAHVAYLGGLLLALARSHPREVRASLRVASLAELACVLALYLAWTLSPSIGVIASAVLAAALYVALAWSVSAPKAAPPG